MSSRPGADGGLAAARPDLRIVAAYLAPSNLCSSHDLLSLGSLRIPGWPPPAVTGLLWRWLHRWFNAQTLPGLNAARAQRGLAAEPHFFEHMLRAPNASVALFPDWFAAVQPDWPRPCAQGDFMLPAAAGAGLSAELEAFLAAGDAPIVFTPGTGHRHAAVFFDAALPSCGGWGGAGSSLRRTRRSCRRLCRTLCCGRRTRLSPRYCRAWQRWRITAASAPPPTRCAPAFRN